MSKLPTKTVSTNNEAEDKKLRKGVFFGKSGDTKRGKGLWAAVEAILTFFGLFSK